MDIDSIPGFIDRFDDGGPRKRLIVLNRTEPEPIQRLFESAFGGEITVDEQALPDADTDVVLLVQGEEVIASSSLQSVMQSFLMINSDTYRTSVRGIDDYRLPAVLSNLDEEVLRLRGYPVTNMEKLLLIAISRYIEATALHAGTGRVDAAFQRIGRMDDEFGTRRVYERLAASDVAVHAYGTGGAEWLQEQGLAITAHTGTSEAYRKSWFVVFTPDTEDGQAAALVCWEVGANVWTGVWTFDRPAIDRLHRYITTAF